MSDRSAPARSPIVHLSLPLLTRLGAIALLLSGTLLVGNESRAAADLHVTNSTPAAGAMDVPASGFISLTFDRPVVTLADVGVAGAKPAATISPAVGGQGRWINTTIWAYQARGGLHLATHYQVTTRAGLTAQDGSTLPGPYTFTFDTLRPAVLSVTPTTGTQYALPKDRVQVVFNQPVRRASAQGAFELLVNGRPVAGRFTWNTPQLATQPNGSGAVVPTQKGGGGPATPPPPPPANTVMTFQPAAPLPLGALVQATVSAGVLGTGGPLPMNNPFAWKYQVAGPLRVLGTLPTNGAGSAAVQSGVTITLTAPVTQAAIQKAVHIAPKPDYQYVYTDDTGTTLTINGDFLPSTTYTITIDQRALGTAHQALAASFVLRFTTQAAQPSIQLVSQGQAAIYDAYLGANIYARVVNLPTIAVSLYRLSPAQFVGLLYNPPGGWSGQPPAGAPLAASWYVQSKAPLNRSLLVRQRLAVNGHDLGPGYYLVDAGPGGGGGGAGDHMLVLITRTAVTLKIGQRQAFVWATDLRSGKPVGGAAVRVVDGNGRLWASGVTNASGVFQATVHGLKSDDSLLNHPLQAQLTRGADVAACGLDWNNGVGPWDFNLPFSSYLQPMRMYLTTERPIYRPGQPVYFKGIVRRDNDGRYALPPAGTPVQVQVQDARQTTIFNARLHTDAYGAFAGTLHLSPGASLGAYGIGASIGVSTANASFQVAAYKKPTFQVTVISDRGANANYVQGERVGTQVRAAYYFGAPLADAPVQWDLTQDDFYFSSSAFPDYQFLDQDYAAVQQQTFFGQQTTEGNGRTDSHGDFHFSVPADIKKHPQSQQYTLEAIVSAPDNSQVAERTQVVVHKAALYIGLRPADYVATAGKAARIRLVTVADDGVRTIGGAPVTVSVYKRIWLSSYVRDANGFYYWQDKHKDTLVATLTTHTGADGQGSVSFTPKNGGEYRIVATTHDAAGHAATSATEIWVVAGGTAYVPWQPQNNDRIRLVADRATYSPGQTAHILVTAPLAGMTALVTVERGGVLSYRLVTLPSNSSQISVPILGYFAPDVYIGVTLVKGPGADSSLPVWRMGYITLPVSTAGQSLHVTISASTAKARPGQRVTFTLHATDSSGQGVQAQFAVALVDKAVLALAASTTAGLMDTFYQARNLGVESAGSMTLYVDNLNLNQKVGSKGGSGGGGGGQGPTRQKFPDTAYWNPAVITDARGNATLSITLPDNLTTWTLSAIGGTSGTLVGQSSMDLISSKQLLLEPALPRFLTVGDQTMGGVVVNNLTMQAQRVHVSIHASGAGPAIDGASTVSVPAGGSQLVRWPVQAGGVGTLTFLFSAQSSTDSSLGDRLQVSLPVQTNNVAKVASSSGLFGASTTQTVPIPAGAQSNQGGLTITLAPSLVSGLGDAVSFLTQYPYDCAEQTTSRYYGLLEAERLPASVSGVSATLAASTPAVVQVALGRLYSEQNSDGGWGWWSEDPSTPYMTAWVLDGLLLPQRQHYQVDGNVLRQAIGYVRNWALNPGNPNGNYYFNYLPDATPTLDLQAYAAYLLGLAGTPDSGLVGTLYAKRKNMLPFARAYLALAVARAAGGRDPRVHGLLAEVAGAAQQFDNQAHWSDKSPDWLMMEDDTSATAIAVQALVQLDPANPLVLAGVRWLLAQRVDGAWNDTQSTALALRALVDFALHTQSLGGTSSFQVTVNGVLVGSGTISDANRGTARTFTVPMATLVGKGAAKVVIARRGGSGQAAYMITLRSYAPVSIAPAVEHGIMVSRRYEPVGSGHGQAGSDVRVVLTVTAPEDLYYLTIEDPLPAGAEPVDPSLRTTSVLSGITSQTTIPKGTNDLGWYVSHVEFRDDRTALFADYLPAGVYQYSYQIHLDTAGTYHALPTQAHLLYFPDIYGLSTGRLYSISS